MRGALTDLQLLDALHLRDHVGLNTTQLAERFRATKGQMIGALHRITKDSQKYDADGNQNGTMKPQWWKR
jgi:hypothetical protein